jgi:hypothetical protein
MRRNVRLKATPATVLGIVALVVAASGASFAASRGTGSITACVHKNGGGLYRAAHCAKHDRTLTWSTTGPPGARGPQGSPGSARGFAFVGADGTVIEKGGTIDIKIDKIKTGEYCLLMNPKPGNFAPILATIQGPDLTAGLINVNTSFGSDCNADGGAGVFTMNAAGKATDQQFVVAVM